MIDAIAKALGQLSDPAFRSVLFRSLLLTVGLLAAFMVAAFWALDFLPRFDTGWINTAVEWLAGAGIVLLSILLIFPVASMFVGVFLEEIAAAVEAKHYAGDPPGKDQSIAQSILTAARFTGVIILANLILLLLLPILIFLPVINYLVFLSVNGYLLGREYFELVAYRHHPPAEVTRLRRRYRNRIWFAGALMAFPLSIPIVNLIVPILGTAFMVHVYKRVMARDAGNAT